MDAFERFSTDRLAYSTLVSAAVASAAVALLFLAIDGLRGNLLFTPSLLGSVVLLGEPASTSTPVRLDMVALFSLVHALGFSIVAFTATVAAGTFEALRRQPLLLGGTLVAVLSFSAVLVDLLLFPGLVRAIGPAPLALANVVAAGCMTVIVPGVLTDEEFDAVPAFARVADADG